MINIGWHFTGPTLRDGSPIPPIGHKLVFEGEIKLCMAGFHFSLTPFEALRYAPGSNLHKIGYGGKFILGDDKGVCTERTILASIDAEHLLRRFAADEALSVAHLWNMPEIVREYLTTTLNPVFMDAAWDAAWDAARAAARAAAMDAARAAAWDAAMDAAWDAAMAAATAAARAAAAQRFNNIIAAVFEEHTS